MKNKNSKNDTKALSTSKIDALINKKNIRANIPQILRALMTVLKFREADLARASKINQATLNTILSGSSKDPRISTLTNIARAIEIRVDQLVGLEPINYKNLLKKDLCKRTVVPIVPWARVGDWLADKFTTDIYANWISTDECTSKKAFALRTKPFMGPVFSQNSVVIINPAVYDELYDGCYIVFYDNGNLDVKRVIRDGGHYYLKAMDPNIPYKMLPADFSLIGVIVETRTSFRGGFGEDEE